MTTTITGSFTFTSIITAPIVTQTAPAATLTVPPVTLTGKATTLVVPTITLTGDPTTVTAPPVTQTAPTSTETDATTTTATTCVRGDPNHKRGASPAGQTTKATSPSSSVKTISTTAKSSSSSTLHTTTKTSSSSSSASGLPSCVAGFSTSQVSAACSCLSIPSVTSTITSTSTITPTVTSTVTPTTTLTPTTMTTPTVTTVPTVSITPSITVFPTITKTPTTTSTPTTTTNSTATVTTTTCSVQPAPTSCGNQGLEFAVYENLSGEDTGDGYPSFQSDVYKRIQPIGTGVIDTLGGFDYTTGPVYIYGQVKHGLNFFVVNHQGYIFAELPGTYTISIPSVDDAVYIWLGDTARSGWTNSNAYVHNVYHYGKGTYPVSRSVDLEQGSYTAIRIVFAQAGGPVQFDIDITAPDGTDFLSANSPGSLYVVQRGCDESDEAPELPAFGNQT